MTNNDSKKNYIGVIVLILSLLSLIAIFTKSYIYMGYQKKPYIWLSFLALGAIFALGSSLLVYWEIINRGYHKSINNPFAFWILFPICLLCNYLAILIALQYIEKFYIHSFATISYFGIFVLWDCIGIKFANNSDLGHKFRNYIKKSLQKIDLICFISIIIVFIIINVALCSTMVTITVKMKQENILLKEIIWGGAIGFHMFVSFGFLISGTFRKDCN